MTEQQPRISVVIAAYKPGNGLGRVLDSLDAQTLPQTEFETIVIDDGSPDDTFERLRRAAASRPNMRVERIDNSGWPSRPRNVATGMARGEWVLFMDHDDSLYPDALRRAAEFALETGADVVSPKESKTSDVWWGMPALADGNIANVFEDGGIERLMPMVPHKLYRREFLLEQGIRFPEGRRMLWEDIYLNVEAYRKAQVVSVLADTPVYLWHASATNSSRTYGPGGAEFWDRLTDLMVFIDETLDGPGFAEARRSMLLHQYRSRLLARFSRMLAGAAAPQVAMALERARELQARFVPEAWDGELEAVDRARAVLLRAGRADLMARLQEIDADVRADLLATSVAWQGGELRVEVEARWLRRSDEAPLRFLRRGDRVLRELPEDLAEALGDDVLDVTAELGGFELTLGIRSRNERVTWQLPAVPEVRFEDVEGGVTPVARAVTVFDPETVAMGRPLDAPFWDVHGVTRWLGAGRGGPVRLQQRAAPALVSGRAQVAYANLSGRLSLDRSQRLRSVVKDGRPALGAVRGRVGEFALALPGVHVEGTTDLPAALAFVPERRPGRRARPTSASAVAATVEVPARIVGDSTGARLTAGGAVRAGRYRLSVRVGEGAMLVSAIVAEVGRHGELRLHREPRPPEAESLPARLQAVYRDRKRRVKRTLRPLVRRLRGRPPGPTDS